MTKYLNTKQAAEQTGFGESTFRYWRSNDDGPPWYQVGRKVVYAEDELLDWIASHRVQPYRRTHQPVAPERGAQPHRPQSEKAAS